MVEQQPRCSRSECPCGGPEHAGGEAVTARRKTTPARTKARASLSRGRKEKPEEEYKRSAREDRTRNYADALAALRGFVREYRPAGSKTGRGPPLSARGAASGFARCFGVRMELKVSRARRGKN